MKRVIFPILAVVLALGACSCPDEDKAAAGDAGGEAEDKARSLFDGESLAGWKPSNYAGNGEIQTAGGVLRINSGDGMLNGVKIADDAIDTIPKVNYEVSMKARRVEGDDFFYCLTFPFKDTHASYVLGGWGGSVCGISSIDYMDAMENNTMTMMEFEKEKWYDIRLVVTDHRIQAFIDNERKVNANVENRKIGMRFGEVEESVPFGISTFKTTGEYKDIKLRTLTEAEIAAATALDDEDDF